jgi:hypothetical protein
MTNWKPNPKVKSFLEEGSKNDAAIKAYLGDDEPTVQRGELLTTRVIRILAKEFDDVRPEVIATKRRAELLRIPEMGLLSVKNVEDWLASFGMELSDIDVDGLHRISAKLFPNSHLLLKTVPRIFRREFAGNLDPKFIATHTEAEFLEMSGIGKTAVKSIEIWLESLGLKLIKSPKILPADRRKHRVARILSTISDEELIQELKRRNEG